MFSTELLKRAIEDILTNEKRGSWKQEYLARKQERDEDLRKCYTVKMRLLVLAYAPDKRSLVEFEIAMLMGLYNAELKKTPLFFMLKELQHEKEIKGFLTTSWSMEQRFSNSKNCKFLNLLTKRISRF